MNYYRVIFDLAQHHKWSVSELENMVPFERELYFGMLVNYLEEKKRQNENG